MLQKHHSLMIRPLRHFTQSDYISAYITVSDYITVIQQHCLSATSDVRFTLYPRWQINLFNLLPIFLNCEFAVILALKHRWVRQGIGFTNFCNTFAACCFCIALKESTLLGIGLDCAYNKIAKIRRLRKLRVCRHYFQSRDQSRVEKAVSLQKQNGPGTFLFRNEDDTVLAALRNMRRIEITLSVEPDWWRLAIIEFLYEHQMW